MQLSNFLRRASLLVPFLALSGCMVFKPVPVATSTGGASPINCEPTPVLVAAPPATSNSSSPSWQWPAGNRVLANSDAKNFKGLNFEGAVGDPVFAASDGIVVYSGNGFKQPGKFIIIKHDEVYLTAYANNRKALVKENDRVLKGQKIAEMGSSTVKNAKLYFEVRESGKPVDPLRYLPSR
jgi:lipoprotein NlpD